MSALLYAFPLSTNCHLVDHHGRVMAGMSPAGAERYLLNVLERECERLSGIGIDCEAALDDYATAIGEIYHALRRGSRGWR